MQKTTRGFIGLLSLLIAIAIIALIFMRIDLFNLSTNSSKDDTKDTRNFVEISTDAIDQAKEVRSKIEENNREAVLE